MDLCARMPLRPVNAAGWCSDRRISVLGDITAAISVFPKVRTTQFFNSLLTSHWAVVSTPLVPKNKFL